MTVPEPEHRSLAPRLPHSLGRFTLHKAVGSGGMATVYLSKMRLAGGLDRLVALKTIHQHLAKEQTFVDMFLDEARIASQITHPNVCAVYDFGEVGEVYYLAMEYLVGEPLFDVINRIVTARSDDLLQTLPYIAARIIADACEGLQAAHDLKSADGTHLGVVHRDVSPQNLFITYEGAVKVVDFGCAKALERVTHTGAGVMKGKVSYAAPEQLREESVDARADVFALGICLWETLTLHQLFRRDTAIKSAMAVLEEPIPRATSHAPWVPEELADIVQKALRRDPNARYQSARDLGRALRAFVARTGVPFESAEIADWMKHLFRDRHEKVLESVAAVEAMEITPSVVSTRPVARENEPGFPVASSTRRERAPLLRPEDERHTSAPQKKTGRIFGVLALLALAFGGAYAAYTSSAFYGLGANEHAELDPVATEANEAQRPIEEPVEEPVDEHAEEPVDEPVEEPVDEPVETQTMRSTSSALRREHRRAAREAEAEAEASEADAFDEEQFTTGSIHIEANSGWAIVEHQGRRLGRTPLNATLPVGPQVLTLYPFGFEPGERITVRIEARTRQRVAIEVDPRDNQASMNSAMTAEP
ncbi:MAG: protein kinase [Polyangiales bacterium]